MQNELTTLVSKAYTAFNNRNIDDVLALMSKDVAWPNGWEGGYVYGHEAVRDYWTRQWEAINPRVIPVTFTPLADGRIDTTVQQTVKDLEGNVIFDGPVHHVYTINNGLITTMEIIAHSN